MLDAGGQARGAVLGSEQVGLQGCAADCGSDAGSIRWLGFEGVDLFEQVAVAVEECAVDSGLAGDAGDADLLAAGRRSVECFENTLAAAG